MGARDMSQANVIEAIVGIFEAEGLDCVELEEGVAVRTAMDSDDGGWASTVEVASLSDELSACVVISTAFAPLTSPRANALELINALNTQILTLGSFELGEGNTLSMRTGLVFNTTHEIPAAMLEHVVFMNWAELEQNLGAFAKLDAGEGVEQILASLVDA